MYGAIGRRMTTSAKKISNRERQRLAQTAILRYEHQRLILLGILGQLGGEVVVSDQTLADLNHQIAREDVDYAIVEGKKPGESIVRLVVGTICTPVMEPEVFKGIEMSSVVIEEIADKGIPGADDAQVSA